MSDESSGLRRFVLGIAVSLLVLVVLFLFAEAGQRVIHRRSPPRAVRDPVLGWRMNADIRREMKGIRSDGKEYDIHFSSTTNGFRMWGDPSAGRKRLLVVGDSFTEAVQVSDDKTYYALLKQKLGLKWEIFAYGEGGYGTLQEFLVMDRYWDAIRPTAVLWQWSGNDFINNSFALDSESRENFSVCPRPYWENGRVIVRCPRGIPLLSRHSELWLFAAPRIFMRVQGGEPGPADVFDASSPRVRDSIAATAGILEMATRRFGKTPVYMFTTGGSEECKKAMFDLASSNGFRVIRDVDPALKAARSNGVPVDASVLIGGHWSEDGHAVVADALYRGMKKGLKKLK